MRERTELRKLWVTLPEKPDDILAWGKRALIEAEDAKYRPRLVSGAKLKSPIFGVGRFKAFHYTEDGSQRIVVEFSSGEKRFVYPEALSLGRLTFVD